ncbi:MAG: polysaccharide deacetylase family protein [Alphaproteobacteria bacterium]|nr:polysaccharide deacetylase family protein [Alphaproteobacteria bacterium]
MAARWSDLADELDRWAEAGRVATLWWRDDDATAPGAKLEHLVAIAGRVPVALAVIPAGAAPELASWLSTRPGLAVLQHGWSHSNHSANGKKSEFPPGRNREDVELDLFAGRSRLTRLFASRALAVLVPPWNRYDESFLPLLHGCGIRGISQKNSRRTMSPAPAVIEVNVHADLVAWAGDRRFVGEKEALGCLVGHLAARRRGAACPDEPTGILTHHLVQDAAADSFLRRLLAMTCSHPAARWLDACEAFAPAGFAPV